MYEQKVDGLHTTAGRDMFDQDVPSSSLARIPMLRQPDFSVTGRKEHMTQPSLILELPTQTPRIFTDLVLDFTGTLSHDGTLLPGVAQRLTAIAPKLRIAVLTADTFGTAAAQLKDLPVEIHIVRTGSEKADLLRRIGPEKAIVIGNGHNDVPMMNLAGLRIAIIGSEGASGDLLRAAHIVVTDIGYALDLIIHPQRLTATLRD